MLHRKQNLSDDVIVSDVVAPVDVLRLAARDGCGREIVGGIRMIRSPHARTAANLAAAASLALFLAACTSTNLPSLSNTAPDAAVSPEMPASIRSDGIVGRWGLAPFQHPTDRPRTRK